MMCRFKNLISIVPLSFVFFAHFASASQFVIELDKPLQPPSKELLSSHQIELNQSFSAGVDSYAIFSASDEAALKDLLDSASIKAEKISEVLFVNSPEIGGGEPAQEQPREGHHVFVIERPIPGVGFFGLDKKKKISQGSNAAITKLGDIIEWEHSYLTNEGTYCVYRADASETLREHGALAGAPIGKITPVIQQFH